MSAPRGLLRGLFVAGLLCLSISQVHALEHLHLDDLDHSCVVCQQSDTSPLPAQQVSPVAVHIGVITLAPAQPRHASRQRIRTVRSRAPPIS